MSASDASARDKENARFDGRDSDDSGSKSRVRRVSERMFDTLEARTADLRRALPALDLGWELARRFRRRNGSVLVGHIAYRLFLWVAPLMLVLAAGLGFARTESFDLVQYARDFGVSTDTAYDVAAQAERSRVTALVIGLPALAIATFGLVRGMHYAYAQAWGVEIRPRRRALRDVGVTMLAAVVLFVVYLAIAVVQRQGAFFAAGAWVGSLAVTVVALWLMCWTMPRRTDRFIELLPGPVLASVGISAVQVIMAVYLPARIESASALYGGIGVAIAALFYMFLIAYTLILVAFVNDVWTDRSEVLAGRPWIIDVNGLPRWARRPLRWAASRQEDAEPTPAKPDTDHDPPAGT